LRFLIFPEKKRASYLSVEKIDFRALSQQGTKYGFSVMHRHTRSQHSQPLDFEWCWWLVVSGLGVGWSMHVWLMHVWLMHIWLTHVRLMHVRLMHRLFDTRFVE
jgi:hypothetical protein